MASNYELPQIRVFQHLEPSLEPSQRAMLPVVIGQVRDLIRFDVDSEKELGNIGVYEGFDKTVEFPNLAASSTVLSSTVRVFADDALFSVQTAQFLDDVQVINPTLDLDTDAYYNSLVDGQENLVIFKSLNMQGTSFYREPAAGDWIVVKQHSQDTINQFGTYADYSESSASTWGNWMAKVIDTVHELVGSSVASPEFNSDLNMLGDADTSTVDVDNVYKAQDGLSYMVTDLADSATETVKEKALNQLCAWGVNNLTSLDFHVRVLNVTEAGGVTLGITSSVYSGVKDTTISDLAGTGVTVEDVLTIRITQAEDSTDLPTKNDRFDITGTAATVDQSYDGVDAKPEITVDTFDSFEDTTYTIEVVSGGAKYIDASSTVDPVIQFKVSTNNSLDNTVITTAEIDADAITLTVGTKGLKVKFDKTGDFLALAKADMWTISCVGKSKAPASGLVLDRDFPYYGARTAFEVSGPGEGAIPLDATQFFMLIGSEINGESVYHNEDHTYGKWYNGLNWVITEYINIGSEPVPDMFVADTAGTSGTTGAYTATGTWTGELTVSDLPVQRMDIQITVKEQGVAVPRNNESGVANWDITTDGDLELKSAIKVRSDSLGEEVFVSSFSGYVQYAAVNNTWSGRVLTIEDGSDDRIGIDDPENPLGYGVRKALLNSVGVPVLAVPVDDIEEDIDDVLELLSNSNNAYQLAPLTFDMSVQDKVIAHALAMSTETMDRWRCAYICTEITSEFPAVEVDDNNDDVIAEFVQNGDIYNRVNLVSTTGVNVGVDFLDSLVRPGDTLRYEYGTDMYGDVSYKELTVLSVESGTSLLVLGDYGSNSSELKIEIHRSTLADDVIQKVGSRSEGLNTRRANNVYPSYAVDTDDVVVPGYFLAAALAGRAAGVEPHQGLTNTKLLGFKHIDTLAPMNKLGLTKLNTLAGSGVTILTGSDADIGVRHELTTCMLDRKNRETMVTRNLDSLSYQYYDALTPFIGIANTTPDFVEKLRTELKAVGNYIISSSKRPLIGSQMTNCVTRKVEQNPVLSDKIDIDLVPELPSPFNYGDLHLWV